MVVEPLPGPTQQRAVVVRGPQDVRVENRPMPGLEPGQALVALRRVGVCGSDVSYVRGTAKYPVVSPFVLGHEASGVVVDVAPGQASTEVVPGARVAITPGMSCGRCERCCDGFDNLCQEVRYLGSAATTPPVDGALRDYIVVAVEQLLPIPPEVSFATAALLEPLGVAEHAVARADVVGRTVLVTGGGAIGQLLSMVALAQGASTVTISEIDDRRRDLASEHGAEAVSPSEVERVVAAGRRYDVTLDATGSSEAVDLCLRAAKPGSGRVVIVGNLHSGEGLSAESISRSEISVTATFRFPGGLHRALDLVTGGLEVEWLVERTTSIDELARDLASAGTAASPIKLQVEFPPASHPSTLRM